MVSELQLSYLQQEETWTDSKLMTFHEATRELKSQDSHPQIWRDVGCPFKNKRGVLGTGILKATSPSAELLL